ncbi:Uu.00g111870.m01.CDS01 [Anthostomella pinea]|uniref:Uu.00g111870.m01.CDS01 n=1 Tax=Anthostomella pinea TaxID=933095 RepID=A0AAI8YGD9_9PEZI|nr:Uu.00g111870.m01.CDS01 [Anthostomella pinea]
MSSAGITKIRAEHVEAKCAHASTKKARKPSACEADAVTTVAISAANTSPFLVLRLTARYVARLARNARRLDDRPRSSQPVLVAACLAHVTHQLLSLTPSTRYPARSSSKGSTSATSTEPPQPSLRLPTPGRCHQSLCWLLQVPFRGMTGQSVMMPALSCHLRTKKLPQVYHFGAQAMRDEHWQNLHKTAANERDQVSGSTTQASLESIDKNSDNKAGSPALPHLWPLRSTFTDTVPYDDWLTARYRRVEAESPNDPGFELFVDNTVIRVRPAAHGNAISIGEGDGKEDGYVPVEMDVDDDMGD